MLTVGEFKPSFIHKKLISDLEDILNKLKEYYEDYKEYFALIELLELCQEGIIDDNNDYLCRYCHDLKNSFIDSIKNPDRREKLDDDFRKIIDNYINEVHGYLKKSIKPSMVIDSLKNNLTFDLGKWKDSSLIKTMFTDAKEDNIKTMVNDINTVHDEILKNGSEEDIELCEEYMDKLNKNNVNGVLPAVLKQLENILVPLHKINYRIGERRVSHEETDKYRTKANPETIFDDEPINYYNMR